MRKSWLYASISHVTSDWSQPPGPTSWKCRCLQEPVDCSPEDGWEAVLVCDNTLGLTPATCSYSLTKLSTAICFFRLQFVVFSINVPVSCKITLLLFSCTYFDIHNSPTTASNWDCSNDKVG